MDYSQNYYAILGVEKTAAKSRAGQWHLDHIIPISKAKTYEDAIILNHYTNFQALWAIDNLRKYNKI
jgi:hypothetical protein